MNDEDAETRARSLRLEAQKHAVALASAVAHEVNNPVAFLSLASGELRRMAEGGAGSGAKLDLARLAELGREIEESAARVGRIVHELRLFTRATEPAKAGTVDLARLVDGALTLAAGQLGQWARIEVAQVDAGAEVPAGLAFALLNVLLSIGDSLARAHRETRTVVRIEATGGAVATVRVEVHGGVPAVDASFAPAPGFALALAADLLAAAGGELVSTRSPDGPLYVLRVRNAGGDDEDVAAAGGLPLPEERITVRDVDATARATSLKAKATGPRVLVIDDETGLARALARRLAARYEVDTAASAAEAIARLDAQSYAAVVCDLHMPDQSGLAIHARVARRSAALAARFVFTTGTLPAGDELHAQALATGCSVLEKPFEGSRLEAEVDSAVKR